MNFFPFMVTGLLSLVAVMWMNLDEPSENLESEPIIAGEPCEVLWKEWKPGLVEATRERGRLIWLTFNAEWDPYSLVHEARLLKNTTVLKKLGEHRVVLIKADYTYPDPAVQKELEKYGRVTIPTNILMPADPDGDVLILPEILTPEIFLKGLDQVATGN